MTVSSSLILIECNDLLVAHTENKCVEIWSVVSSNKLILKWLYNIKELFGVLKIYCSNFQHKQLQLPSQWTGELHIVTLHYKTTNKSPDMDL